MACYALDMDKVMDTRMRIWVYHIVCWIDMLHWFDMWLSTVLNLRTIDLQANMRAIGNELCSGIIKINIH